MAELPTARSVTASAYALGALVINLTCAVLLVRHRHHSGSLTKAAWLSARNDAVANLAIIAVGCTDHLGSPPDGSTSSSASQSQSSTSTPPAQYGKPPAKKWIHFPEPARPERIPVRARSLRYVAHVLQSVASTDWIADEPWCA